MEPTETGPVEGFNHQGRTQPLDVEAAAGIHYVDQRVGLLARTRHELNIRGVYRGHFDGAPDTRGWHDLTDDEQSALRTEARNWLRAAVGAGLLPPYGA